jgi:hypothetical protein
MATNSVAISKDLEAISFGPDWEARKENVFAYL